MENTNLDKPQASVKCQFKSKVSVCLKKHWVVPFYSEKLIGILMELSITQYFNWWVQLILAGFG